MLKLPENHVFRSKKPIEGQKNHFSDLEKIVIFSAQKYVVLKLIAAIETHRKCFRQIPLTNIEI